MKFFVKRSTLRDSLKPYIFRFYFLLYSQK